MMVYMVVAAKIPTDSKQALVLIPLITATKTQMQLVRNPTVLSLARVFYQST